MNKVDSGRTSSIVNQRYRLKRMAANPNSHQTYLQSSKETIWGITIPMVIAEIPSPVKTKEEINPLFVLYFFKSRDTIGTYRPPAPIPDTTEKVRSEMGLFEIPIPKLPTDTTRQHMDKIRRLFKRSESDPNSNAKII